MQDPQKLVENFKPNAEVTRAMARIELVGLVAPTASGKTTIINYAVEHFEEFAEVIDETSRSPRQGEIDGADMIFLTPEQIIADIKQGNLVQVALGPNGDFYCTRPSSYPKKGIGLLPMVPSAVVEFRRLAIKKFEAAFIVPADFDSWVNWFKNQASASRWNQQQIFGRLDEAKRSYEFALGDPNIHFVLNDTVEKAAQRLYQLAMGRQIDSEQLARQTAKDNYQKLISFSQARQTF